MKRKGTTPVERRPGEPLEVQCATCGHVSPSGEAHSTHCAEVHPRPAPQSLEKLAVIMAAVVAYWRRDFEETKGRPPESLGELHQHMIARAEERKRDSWGTSRGASLLDLFIDPALGERIH